MKKNWCKNGHPKPKHIPYGSKRGKGWCGACDRDIVPDEPSNKRTRRKAKQALHLDVREHLQYEEDSKYDAYDTDLTDMNDE